MSSPILVDSHCHLDKLNQDIVHTVAQASANDVAYMLTVGVTLDAFPAMFALVAEYNQIFVSAGIHPSDVKGDENLALLEEYAQNKKVIAIGETGLDYFHQTENKKQQHDYFAYHIDLAKRTRKPLIVHTRSSKEDMIQLLKQERAEEIGGIIHCFTEDWDTAKQALDLGFYISISGIVTFKKAIDLQEVVRKLPLDRLLIETDSPYLSPVPVRGKENQPAYVKHVAQFIADLRNMNYLQVAEQTTANFFELFKEPIAAI